MGNSENSEKEKHSGSSGIVFMISLVRGAMLFILGFSLLLIPEKTHAMLFNAMGIFWLISGIISVRREMQPGQRNWPLLVVGAVGVLVGLLVVTRDLTRTVLAEVWVKNLLGAAILFSGGLHVLTGLGSWKGPRERSLIGTLLGVVEIVLGALLIFGATGHEQIVYYAALVWALLGGALVLGGAVYSRIQAKSDPTPLQSQPTNQD